MAREAVPALHLIEPGRIAVHVVDMEAGPLSQPGPNLGGLVGSVVVNEQVDVQNLRYRLLDLPEEAQ